MQSHCTNYERKTHPLIIRLALSIAGYSSNGDYSAICNDIKKMEAGSSQEALKLNRNIKTITEFINDSRDAKDKLKAFEVETSQDFIAADEKTKKLDAVVRVYEEDITKEFDSIEGTKRIIDIPSNAFNQFFARRAARKQAEASQSVLGHLTEVKENGDAMKVNLQEIRDLADNAQKAIEALIGGLENVSEQLEDIKKIVLNTDLRKARGFVVEFLESNLLERWKAVGELAREFVLDAHLS
ncbi:hypothetical protein F5887DRAFT_994900 [Amanita rubescens]|nr:hypothetical protein F5887DRAFT_994900 [Amanita rubescens]